MMIFLNEFWQAGLYFGIAMGLIQAFDDGWEKGLRSGAFSGFTFGLIIASIAYFNSRKYTKDRPLLSNEKLIEEGHATHQKNGGWVYLTNTRYIFVSAKISLTKPVLSIPLSEILSAEKARSYGVISNKLILNLKNGEREEFVVANPKNWVNRVENFSGLSIGAPQSLSIYD